MPGQRYVMARTRAKRPTLQHEVSNDLGFTKCGTDMTTWSVVYMSTPIPVLLCRRCNPVPKEN